MNNVKTCTYENFKSCFCNLLISLYLNDKTYEELLEIINFLISVSIYTENVEEYEKIKFVLVDIKKEIKNNFKIKVKSK